MAKRMCFAVLGCLLVATSAIAQEASSPVPVAVGVAVEPMVVSANHVLKKTTISYDSAVVPVAAGFQPLDAPTTITCPGSSGNCMITVDQNVQVRGTAPNNQWAVCTQVDGVFMTQPNCPFLGVVPAKLDTRSFQQSDTTVSAGAHTVQTFLFTEFGGDRGAYHITYKIFKP